MEIPNGTLVDAQDVVVEGTGLKSAERPKTFLGTHLKRSRHRRKEQKGNYRIYPKKKVQRWKVKRVKKTINICWKSSMIMKTNS